MRVPFLLGSLAALSVTFATQLALWREQAPREGSRSGSVMEILMGDSRRLVANHFITKADVYLHSGVYPSIFDQGRRETMSHLAQSANSSTQASESPAEHEHSEACSLEHHDENEHDHDHCDADGFLGKPRDWIDAFGRNFYPTEHTHLDAKGDQREILPWLRLAAELNPNDVGVYPLGAYWLRQRMGKVKEAEQFLREGWRANPNSFQILFELGRLFEENHHDDFRARNLFETALRKWRDQELFKEKPNVFALMEISGHLARLEERAGNSAKAIQYLEVLKTVSPNPELIQRQIDELR